MKVLVTGNYVVDEFGAAQIDSFEEVDIPDGCVLAVVEKIPEPDVDGGDVKLFQRALSCDEIKKVFWAMRGYRRVIQEVKP